MSRHTRLAAKQTKPENEAQCVPKSKKKRPEKRITDIALIDNGTTLETFKYLNYSQLAKTSLVSKRFSNLIRTHRHSLALLFVDQIYTNNHGEIDAICPFFAKIFNKRLSPDAYNGWIVRNGYLKQVLPKCQVRGKGSRQNDHKIYEFNACAVYKGANRRRPNGGTKAFFARMKLDKETWPLLQHFVRLLTDSFIYIRHIELISRNELLNLLTDAKTPERGRLQCEEMHFYLEDNVQKCMNWLKNNVRCDKFQISDISGLERNEELLNFFITGGHCTSAIDVRYYDLSQDRSYIIVDLVQKFLDLKTCDEYELVDSIQYNSAGEIVEALKYKYTKFIVKVEMGNYSSPHIFQFVNKDIGKKMEFTTTVIDDDAEYCNGIAFDNPSDTHVLVSIDFENL